MLVNNMATIELCKAHKLFEHYFAHVDRDSKITVLDFLAMHYFGEDIDDNDHEQDMELPFKKYEGKVSNYSYFSILKIEILPQPGFNTAKNSPFFESSIYIKSNFSSLFRPPQV